MASTSVKMPLGNALNVLLAHPSAITRQERRASSETTRRSSREERVIVRKNFYLTARAAQILTETATKDGKSESSVANEAIFFYDERGQYIEELIKKSVREAFLEFKPAMTRSRALVRTARSIR